jgi:glutaredoxin
MEVILYSNGCPKCKVLETKLKQKDIEYEHISDIDVMMEKGFMSMPMLQVDNKLMNFTEANTWINERN